MDKNNSLQNVPNNSNIPSIRLEDYQAFYHWLNAKPDTEVKVFPNNRRFRFDDIKELNFKIEEKLKLHDIVSNSTNVTIFLSNKRILEFGSWEKFINYDYNISAETKAISVIWDFYVKLPNYTLPQRHTLKIRVGSNIKPGELIQLLFQGDDELSFQEAASHVVCKVDFINPVICNELFGIVSEWHDSLIKNLYENKFETFLQKNKRKIYYSFKILLLFAGAFILAPLLNVLSIKYEILIFDSLKFDLFILGFSIYLIGMYIFYLIGGFLGDKTLRLISSISPLYYFDLTKGDKNVIMNSVKSNKKQVYKIVKDFIIAIVVNIIAFLISTTLMDEF